ncbi:hypothetical protein ElyMa_000493600 [Elysia marginata]|uniref:Uncharacterized protein n=1 Tax=Elysia marginata TaxID=1093978 RepID=A0AAV4FV18_9GAST|nr:hypothetical protein ElyMa_000493600 [Elysia marginata]
MAKPGSKNNLNHPCSLWEISKKNKLEFLRPSRHHVSFECAHIMMSWAPLLGMECTFLVPSARGSIRKSPPPAPGRWGKSLASQLESRRLDQQH